MRKTVRQISALVAAERVGTPGFKPLAALIALGIDKSLRFMASVTIGATAYEVAADNGKIKVFSDVDAFVKTFAKFSEDGNGNYDVTVQTGELLASRVPADFSAAAEAAVTRLTKVKNQQIAKSAALAGDIVLMAGWDVGNAAQRARLTEVTEQKAAVDGDIVALTAEIAAQTLLITP